MREEDKVYSLLGIFGVFTFLNYGEGETNAFKRLRKAIAKDLRESSQPQASVGRLGGCTVTYTPGTYIATDARSVAVWRFCQAL
jgi:hypothetical protein